MKKILIVLLVCFSMQSCFKDNSLNADKAIIEIGVKNDARDTINIYFNEGLKINSQIDAGKSQQISYEWGVGKFQTSKREDAYGNEYIANTTVFHKVSEDQNLDFIPRELGHYMIRNIVTNEHGSTIKYHHLFVNSPFEEGFLILARQPDGKGNMSFLKTLTPEDIENGMQEEFRQNVYKDVNGVEQYEDPVDVFKIEDKLYLLYGKGQKLVALNAKTMEHILEYDFKYYRSDFIPTSCDAYDGRFCREVVVGSLSGDIAQVQLVESGIFPFPEQLPSGYKFTHIFSRPTWFSSSSTILYSEEKNVVCWSGSNQDREFSFMDCYGYFKDKEVMHIFQDDNGDSDIHVSIINKQGGTMKITQIGASITNMMEGGLHKVFEHTIPYPQMINDNTKFLRNDKFSCVFFGYQNGIYKWFYSQSGTMPAPGNKFCNLPEGEEVRSLAHYTVPRNLPEGVDYAIESRSKQTEIYVATYNPNRAGEYKGSIYIFNAETGAEIKRYEGISYEPIELLYKIK